MIKVNWLPENKKALILCSFLIFQLKMMAGGTINSVEGCVSFDSLYVNNITDTWIINTGVNKPVIFEFWIDLENNYDYVHFYAIDMYGNDFHIATYTGSQCCYNISTNFPTGKAKIVFQTDGSVCRPMVLKVH